MKIGIRSCSSLPTVNGYVTLPTNPSVPHPQPTVPIPMSVGSGFKQVWVQMSL